MNIVIIGAGAIGSLFGGLLSKNNTVVLVGRTSHTKAIQHDGLHITGKNHLHVKLSAVDSIKDMTIAPDLVLLTVKSYDTETAIRESLPLISKETIVLSLQNGLDNIEKVERVIQKNQILAGVTTHGALFSKPGVINHTGIGKTILGELNGALTTRLERLVWVFNEAGIVTSATSDIEKEIWAKAIINSSINPLTTFFQCRNGYLLENPVLDSIVESICQESTSIAQHIGIQLTTEDMIQRTKKVIMETAKNYSSMVQSIQQGKKTEIASINGVLATCGKQHGLMTPLNDILITLITSIT
jgi:2-dehydropantoate 2-reductase